MIFYGIIRYMPKTIHEITISTRTIINVLFACAMVLIVFKLDEFLLLLCASIVIATFIQSIALEFDRYRIPRFISVTLVFGALVALIGTLLYFLLPTFIHELSGIVTFLPEGTTIRSIIQTFGDFSNAQEVINSLGTSSGKYAIEGAKSILPTLTAGVTSSLSSAFGGILNVVLLLIISFYFALLRDGVEQFLRAVSPHKSEEYIISLWKRTERKIALWFRGQLALAFIMSLLTYVCLLVFGVPYAFLLALSSGVFGLIPFGTLIATIPALIISFLSGGVPMVIIVSIIYFLLHQIENYILQPLIVNRATGVPSLVILLSIIAGAKLAGFAGLFLGLPAAIMVTELVADYDKKKRF